MPATDDRVRISSRTALIFLLGLAAGVVVGVLTYAAVGSVPEAVLAGLPAAGGAVFAFDRLIDPAPRADQPDTSAPPRPES